ncbi:hypothetical protein ASD19_07365 [Microbacterium sp. Root53]|uniref:hypothetical protein n=1 Tax=Microbacterium sp. Root53 TaxID=1736553 RepID=UPI0007007162|nr:hypothetical protein [Microbacterium sp. Root53]KQY98638.1 hypothetical protein ASD19_07365 [Microbacterium sp. Root53]
MTRVDSFSPYDAELADAGLSEPWTHVHGRAPVYRPDYPLLERLLTIAVTSGKASNAGALANGVDSWLAHELRRSGFSSDEVWPRASRPRILPRDVAALLSRLPDELRTRVTERLIQMPSVAPTDARILGRAYEKQVDVVISRWDRGPELLLSTKTQVSSFGKNLSNRFEEAYGDAGNLRSRHPLAAVGFFFVQRSTILRDEPEAFERTVDMMRKLRDTSGLNGYTATALALASWGDPADGGVRIDLDRVPEDIRPEQFFVKMIDQVLNATPVSQHVAVRSMLERRPIPVAEDDSTSA